MLKMIAALTALFLTCASAGAVAAQTAEPAHKAQPHRHYERELRKNPVTMTEESVREGRKLYAKHCIACHKKNGTGGIGPDLTDDRWIHGPSDGEIFQVITDGVPATAMRAYKKEMPEEMRWHLVNYLKSLRNEPPISLTSEQVHWIVGGWISIIAFLLILNETGVLAARWVRWLLPIGTLAVGIQLIIDPLLHGAAAPGGYEHETAQHYMLGAGLIAMGAIEALRKKEILRRRFWSMVLPTGLIATGAVFLLHAQHEASVPIVVLIAQHRVIGATLWLAGLAKALAEIRSQKTGTFAVVWLVLLLLFGIELLLYTEGGSLFGESFLGHSGHIK